MVTKKCPKCNIENPIAASYCRQCGYEFPEETKSGKSLAPVIKEFLIIPDYYTIGSIINIMWEVENATSVTLNGETITNHDSYEYIVKGDATLDLLASNDYKQELKHIRISPNPVPKILSFESNKKRVKEGDEIKISWEYKHVDKAVIISSLHKEEIPLAGKKTIKYKPKMGEELTLVCFSKDKNVKLTRELELAIIADVCIDSFTIDRKEVIESSEVILSWNVRNATSLVLLPDNIEVTDKNSILLYPTRSTEYQLKASNELSTRFETIAVCVKPLPKLQYAMPDFSGILNMSTFELNINAMVSNINEIRIDRWMRAPLTGKRKSNFSKFLRRFKDYFTTINMPNIIDILPGANLIIKCMRIVLLIVAILILICNVLQLINCGVLWIQIVSGVCAIFSLLYIFALFQITKTENIKEVDNQDLWIVYFLLCLSSVSPIILFLCGGDYDLYNILGKYILLEIDKMIFPFVTLIFITITYWVSIKSIYTIYQKEYEYSRIKTSII